MRLSRAWGKCIMISMQRTLVRKTVGKIGRKVKLQGWVSKRRDHGRIVFLDLRDRSGIVQCVVGNSKLVKEIENIRAEYVVEIEGKVKRRPDNMVNPNLKTGKVEVEVGKLEILAKSRELPLPIDTDGYKIDEEVRLKYRYLDLRRERLTKNLRLRSRVVDFMRKFLIEREFIEIETPILTKTTPEGARDFLVPSRLQKGKFYALPQSPQQYKQLLMVSGFERYFQIARCFRDEESRSDRAYGEFTQLDIEMSFITQEDILNLIEELFTKLVREVFPDKKMSWSPWPRISHNEAQKKYGSDKPDLRKNKKDKDELSFAWVIDFPLFVEQTKEDYFYGAGEKLAPSHHMFTAPHPEDIKLLNTEPLKVRGLQYDMVLNGYEVGGGSIRIHDGKILKKVFDLIGFTKKQNREFEHMLTAFRYGVPPHGGVAPGIDRFLMAVLGEPSLREVIAFPATSGGRTAALNAPSRASKEQLKELGITIRKK
jgi:aspartyl-tRNA synthetase